MFQPCWGVASPPQPPPFLTALIFLFSRSFVKLLVLPPISPGGDSVWFGHKAPPRPAFSEADSWCRDLAAASASAAGGAAPAPTGPAASWSWTRSTAEEQTRVRVVQVQVQREPEAGAERKEPEHLEHMNENRTERQLTFRLSSSTVDDSSIGDS